MSVTRTSNSSTSTTDASARLAAAIERSSQPAPAAKPDATTAALTPAAKPAPLVAAAARHAGSTVRGTTTATRDASVGAHAAPDNAAATSEAANNVQSVAPGADTTGGGSTSSDAYSPYQASTDAYASQGPGTAPAGTAPAGDAPADASSSTPSTSSSSGAATDAAGSAPASAQATGSTQATGAWTPKWESTFESLQLAPADIAYLAQGNFTDQQLAGIAQELGGVDALDPSAPQPGVDAGSVASANGPTAADVAPGQPGVTGAQEAADGAGAVQGTSAWSPEWKTKFTDVMTKMGMPKAEIDQQLAAVGNQPITEDQLNEAYRQMSSSLGAYDDGWKTKFTTLMDKLKVPAAEREQVMQQLAGSGLTEAQLQEAYTKMEATAPAWSPEYETKFKSLDVPDEMLKQLKDSGAPKEALDAQFQKLLDTKMKYSKDGRLGKLQDAGATSAEKWGIMLDGKEGKDFDKILEQVHSSHVSGWARVGSFALNLIPGVYAVQFAFGKDFITGEKIDRTNPLNIIGAVASGFAGFTAVRSAVAGVQGLSAASRAATATMQAAKASTGVATGLSASVETMGSASALGKGALDAIEGANLVSKFEKGLKFTDYLKSAVPIVNRFGEAGRLSSVGRGYTQGMQLAAGAAALKNVEGGGAVVDKAIKGTVLSELKQGKGIESALETAGRSGRAGDATLDAAKVASNYNKYGFLQGNVSGKFGVGNGSGNAKFNPFKSNATISETSNPNVFSLGRSVNFATKGGLAQGLGAVQGANLVSNAGLYSQAATRAADANPLIKNAGSSSKIAGINIADDVQRAETFAKTANWAEKLGVSGGSKFRTLLQLGGSNRAAARVAGVVENGGNTGYRVARQVGVQAARAGGFVATPLVAGAAVGLTGRQMQPGWDYLKDRDAIQARERAAQGDATKEQADLERLYEQEHGGAASGGGAPADAGGAGTAAAGTGGTAQVVGTSPTGGQLVFDPAYGAVIDTSNGDVYDPTTQQKVGNLNQAQGGAPQGAAQPADASAAGGGGSGSQQVFRDPQTGYFVDPTTGLMADPATGKVYDPKTGAVVGNVSTAQQPAA